MSNPSPPHNWDATYETNPADGDVVSFGDNWIRNVKIDVRERAEVEHNFGSANSPDNGLHRLGSARAFVDETAPTAIAITDHDNTGGAGVTLLSANASNSSPAETVGLGRLWWEPGDGDLHVYDSTGWARVIPMPRNHLSGFGMTVINANDDISIAQGEARTGTSADRNLRNARTTTAIVKQIDATWAAGTNAGGMATGAVAADTWYHVFIIVKPSGAVDAGFDTDDEATNLLANLDVLAAGFTAGDTTYRRIGSIKTAPASTDILDFIQAGDEFVWKTRPALESTALADHSGSDKTQALVGAPPDFTKMVRVQVTAELSAGANNVVVASSDVTIGAVGGINADPLPTFFFDGANLHERETLTLLLNQTNDVIYRSSAAFNARLNFQVVGWTDLRGKR